MIVFLLTNMIEGGTASDTPVVTVSSTQNIANWLAPSLHVCIALWLWVKYGP